MSKSLAAASARLGFLVVAVCLTAAACSVTTATPQVVASQSIRPPDGTTGPVANSGSPASQRTGPPKPRFATTPTATIYLPPDFDSTRAAWRDIDQALKKAAVDHEPVLIDFGSSWCLGCVELEQSFQAPQVQAMVRSLHLVRVDTGPQGALTNSDIAAAYGLDLNKTGIPGLVLLSPLGKTEATTNNGLFDNTLPNSPSEIIGFLKPHL